MIIEASMVITIVTIIVLVACYKATVVSMEANEFHQKNHKDD